MDVNFPSPLASRMERVEASPKIVRAGKPHKVKLLLDRHAPVGERFDALLIPGSIPLKGDGRLTVTVQPGETELLLPFEGEQEYMLILYRDQVPALRANFYALEEDLFSRLPMKGDFHMHTTRSDGNIDLERAPAKCRRVGLDLMAISDHRLFEPSEDAIAYYRDCPHDLILCTGEEVHAPDNPVHIVNLNGRSSVNGLYRADEPKYRAEVAEILKELPESSLQDAEKYAVASSIWAARKIKEAGGLAVFCHPYWEWSQRKHDFMLQFVSYTTKYISDGVEDAIWDCGEFDAVEMIGGFGMIEHDYDSDLRSVISYYEHLAKGQYMPPVGTSDCHRWEDDVRMGWYFTVTFAESWDAEGFIRAIREGYTVGCENYITRMTGPRSYGSKRLTQYTQYLFREIFPEHDRLCLEESALMDEAAEGGAEARAALEQRAGEAESYIRNCFAKD